MLYAFFSKDGDASFGFIEAVKRELGIGLTNKTCGADLSMMQVMNKVAELDLRPSLSQLNHLPLLQRLLQRCWAVRGSARPTFETILANLAEIKVEVLINLKTNESEHKLALQRQQDETDANNAREEEEAKKILFTARSNVHNFKTPMVLVSASQFIKFSKFESFETLRDRLTNNDLKSFDNMELAEVFIKKHFTIFFSHQWLSWTRPDPNNVQLPVMKAACEKLSQNIGLEKCWVWYDYGCIPQASRDTQQLAVHSLPAISSTLQSFVVIAPEAKHDSSGEICDLKSYSKRGWCRAEVASHVSRRGKTNVYIGVGADNIKLIAEYENDQDGDLTSEMLDVFNGEYTCCRLGHRNKGRCDRESLMEPMLGLYSDIYKRRYKPNIQDVYEKIVAKKKKIVYPPSVSVTYQEDDTSATIPLYKNYLTIVESTVDFENMIEAAGTSSTNSTFRESVEFQQEADDLDLTPILIQRHDLSLTEISLDGNGSRRVVKGLYRGHAVAVKIMQTDDVDDEFEGERKSKK